jgi:hypothetical protein
VTLCSSMINLRVTLAWLPMSRIQAIKSPPCDWEG